MGEKYLTIEDLAEFSEKVLLPAIFGRFDEMDARFDRVELRMDSIINKKIVNLC